MRQMGQIVKKDLEETEKDDGWVARVHYRARIECWKGKNMASFGVYLEEDWKNSTHAVSKSDEEDGRDLLRKYKDLAPNLRIAALTL